MKTPGASVRSSSDVLIQSRSALLDALDALDEHREAVIVIGAQAVYLRTSAAPVALAEATKDSDLAVDPRELGDKPLLEEAMNKAGFYLNPDSNNPGAWLNPAGIPVDLMVPEALAGGGGKQARGARIPPHGRQVARRARGLEACLVDNSPMDITALDPADQRRYTVKVAGPASLLVAKLYKIAERVDQPDRLNDKDAHDLYRILIDVDTADLTKTFERLLADQLSSTEAGQAQQYLAEFFAAGPTALGSTMAGRAEPGSANQKRSPLRLQYSQRTYSMLSMCGDDPWRRRGGRGGCAWWDGGSVLNYPNPERTDASSERSRPHRAPAGGPTGSGGGDRARGALGDLRTERVRG